MIRCAKPVQFIVTLFISLALVGCSRDSGPTVSPAPETTPQNYAQQIFVGGPIVTMDTAQRNAQAVAIHEGKILAVGSQADVEQLKNADTEIIDLRGNTLVPGFVDGHSHFSMAVNAANWANLSGAPVGKVTSIADVVAELVAQQARNASPVGEWVVGYGYDADTLSDARQMTRDDLDAAFPDTPVIAIHVSFHGGVLNSKAFELIGYDSSTATPAGGVIVRRDNSNEPLGLIMETAWFEAIAAMPKLEGDARFQGVRLAQEMYASMGITTAQDGASSLEEFELYKEVAARNDFFIDLVALGGFGEVADFIAQKADYQDYNGRLKLGGIKIVADGSPQGKTAFFSEPYLTGGPGGEENWRGEPIVPQEQMDQLLEMVYQADMQAFVHANADAAIDLLLNSHKKYQEQAGEDSRTVIIHSQFVRQDQLEAYAQFGMVPSFFTNHAFFWGDVHRENLGEARADFLSPLKSALDLGIHFTNHNDYIVTPLDQLFTVWSAVNRISRSGEVIGPDQRISPEQALHAVTLGGAWQYGEEDSKGSISEGKLADLVILDGNPLTVDPMAIKDIRVLATYKEGELIYSASGGG